MALSALRGALGFLSRLPVGRDGRAWQAFRSSPWSMPAAGYLIGALLAAPLLAPVGPATALVVLPGWLYALTGITHLDGLADAGDALAAHGAGADERDVMKDSQVGVGGSLAVALAVLGVGGAGMALADLPAAALGVVVVSEVGAKLSMATMVCLSESPAGGMGQAVTAESGPASLPGVYAVGLPALALTLPRPAVAAAVLAACLGGGFAVRAWAVERVGGVDGDVLGAANELARVAGLHAGVIAWTRL